jgi:hypothetical protein
MLDIETVLDAEEGEAFALQRCINAGQWSLQGSFGRTMMDAIKSGRCALGRKPAKDYWGNFIPSRDMVKPGTHGSIDYVAQIMGDDYAAEIEGVE